MRTRTLRDARAMLATTMILALGLVLSGCGTDSLSASPTPEPSDAGQSGEAQTLVVGNIDASNPAEKIEEFQPLVDYLVANLESFDIDEGRVVIAQDTAEMARMLGDGEVDIYIDAAIPSLEVCAQAGCDFALRQWKGGGPDLAGVFVTTEASGIDSLDDLLGHVIMLEQPHSTVGHILPLAALARQDIKTRQVTDLEATVADDEVGYYVSSGGQTSVNLLLNGDIVALAIGERAYEKFSPDVQEQAIIFESTIAAPSQLVTFRPGFDAELESEIRSLMLALEESDEGQAILESLRDTAQFDEFLPDMAQELDDLYELVKQVTQE